MKVFAIIVVVMVYIGGALGAGHAITASSCDRYRGPVDVGFVALSTAAVWPVFIMAEIVSSVAGHRMPICDQEPTS